MSSNPSSPAIVANGLSKTYLRYASPFDRLKQSFWQGKKQFFQPFEALKPISFTLNKGETVGIVGRNGSGKSTLLQLICGTLAPTEGECEVHGRISALLELGAGFNPDFTGRENVRLNGAILGMSPEMLAEKYDSIVAFAGIGDFMEQPVKTYSSGMYVRLAFAVAVASDPDILIVDEALAVGDEMFQRKCFSRIRAIQEQGGTILFVSHAASAIVELCSRALLLDSGELLLSDTPKRVISYYHKLLFAPEDKRTQLREALKHPQLLPSEINEKGKVELVQDASEKPYFDPSLQTESTVSYEMNGAVINDPHIETLEGKRVNVLVRRQRYRYCFRVQFAEHVYAVRFAFMIKTKTGIEIGGSASNSEGEDIEAVKAGATIDVTFEFTALLLPGVYFTNNGCSGLKNGERVTLHRMMDASMFRVMPEKALRERGMVDLMTEPAYSFTDGA